METRLMTLSDQACVVERCVRACMSMWSLTRVSFCFGKGETSDRLITLWKRKPVALNKAFFGFKIS